jgi:hypothetical protein
MNDDQLKELLESEQSVYKWIDTTLRKDDLSAEEINHLQSAKYHFQAGMKHFCAFLRYRKDS